MSSVSWFSGPGDEEYAINLGEQNESYYNPFESIETEINTIYDPDIFPHLTQILKSASMDDEFRKNRKLKSFPQETWRVEEFCLLHRVSRLLNGEPMDQTLGSMLLRIMGRDRPPICEQNFPFDPELVSQSLPEFGDLYSGMDPCIITPSLLFDSITSFVQMPHDVWIMEKIGAQEIIKKLDPLEVVITDENSIRKELLLRELPPIVLSLDNAYCLTGKIRSMVTDNDCKWYTVSCGAFTIAFGFDISNGNDEIKFPWINTLDGTPPPTIPAEKGKAPVEWLARVSADEEEKFLDDIDWCPFYNENCHEDKFVDSIEKVYPEIRFTRINQEGKREDLKRYQNTETENPGENSYVTIIWADRNTGLLQQKDLASMVNIIESQEHFSYLLVECSPQCRCHRDCMYCPLEKGPNPNLTLIKTPTKGWGVFAKDEIKAGTLITEYSGEAIPLDEVGTSCSYILAPELDDLGRYCYDAENKGNIGRFINHAHKSDNEKFGPFSQPNVIAIGVKSYTFEMLRVGIFALRNIYAGEEITMDYGDKYVMGRDCTCITCLKEGQRA